MKTAAYVSFGLMGVLLIAMLTLSALAIWESDGRYGALAGVAFVGAVFAVLAGGFFASQAGMGVKK